MRVNFIVVNIFCLYLDNCLTSDGKCAEEQHYCFGPQNLGNLKSLIMLFGKMTKAIYGAIIILKTQTLCRIIYVVTYTQKFTVCFLAISQFLLTKFKK